MYRAFCLEWFSPRIAAKQVNHSQNVLEAIILGSLYLHVNQISLPLVIDTAGTILTSLVTRSPCGFVQCICLLSFQPLLNCFWRESRSNSKPPSAAKSCRVLGVVVD